MPGLLIAGFGTLRFFPGVSPAQPLVTRAVDLLTFGVITGQIGQPSQGRLRVLWVSAAAVRRRPGGQPGRRGQSVPQGSAPQTEARPACCLSTVRAGSAQTTLRGVLVAVTGH